MQLVFLVSDKVKINIVTVALADPPIQKLPIVWYLKVIFRFKATKNPFYLHVGREILDSLERYARARCGYASLHNVLDKSQEDRMESFFLSETCKYLYLVCDWQILADLIFSIFGLPRRFALESLCFFLRAILRIPQPELEFAIILKLVKVEP